MKKSLLFGFLILGMNLHAQVDCDKLKTENESLKIENTHLKKVLNINKPILEAEKDDLIFKVIEVKGNAKEKTLQITALISTKNETLNINLNDLSIIDLEGNEYEFNYLKSSNVYNDLSKDVPVKFKFVFKNVAEDAQFLKLFKFRVTSRTVKYSTDSKRTQFEFRDLKVVWN